MSKKIIIEPEIKSVGFMRVSPGSKDWVSYVITTKGQQVVKIEMSEPDQRGIAEEAAKMTFVRNFIDQE